MKDLWKSSGLDAIEGAKRILERNFKACCLGEVTALVGRGDLGYGAGTFSSTSILAAQINYGMKTTLSSH